MTDTPPHPPATLVLTLSCPDIPGIVAAVAGTLAAAGCNILESQQHDDLDSGQFFMRVEFRTEGGHPATEDTPAHTTRWLALHPAVGRRLRWTPDLTELFCWHGDDGLWRARSIRRARGQLGHPSPGHAYCAEGWQVVLSDTGLAEMRRAFGPLRRDLLVERTLPARPREDRLAAETSHCGVSLTEPR
jgi:hypothetical protein